MGHDFRKLTERMASHSYSSAKRKKLANALLAKEEITEEDYLDVLTTTGEKKCRGLRVRESYEARKYKKGSHWYIGTNKNLKARGLAYTLVEVIDTYKTYSRERFTNWTIHVRVLEGEKAGKEYRLSNIALYTKEELT